MIKLCDIVDIQENNNSSILLKVKENKKVDLISLGFDPTLDYIYLSKGKRHTMKLINTDNKVTSFDFGDGGYTIISSNLQNQKNLILNCITDDFGITYYGDIKDFQKTNCIYSLSDKANIEFNLKLLWFDKSDNISMHRDNSFFKSFNSLQEAKKYIHDNYTIYKEHGLKLSEQTGCNILEFDTFGKDLSCNYELE